MIDVFVDDCERERRVFHWNLEPVNDLDVLVGRKEFFIYPLADTIPSLKTASLSWEFENPPYYSHPLIESKVPSPYEAYSERLYRPLFNDVLVVESSPSVVPPTLNLRHREWDGDFAVISHAHEEHHWVHDSSYNYSFPKLDLGNAMCGLPQIAKPFDILVLDLSLSSECIDGNNRIDSLTMLNFFLEAQLTASSAIVEAEQPTPSQPTHHKNKPFKQNRRRVPYLAASRKPTALPLRQ